MKTKRKKRILDSEKQCVKEADTPKPESSKKYIAHMKKEHITTQKIKL